LKNDNRKIEEVKQAHNDNKFQFINSLGELKKTPTYITSISKPKAKSNLNASHPQQNFENFNSQKNNEKSSAVGSINIYKIATFIVTLLLFATWAYIIFLKPNLESETLQDEGQAIIAPLEQLQAPETIKFETTLNPVPNSELIEYRNLAKKIPLKKSLQEVVEIIFNNNPIDIKNIYKDQIGEYSNLLLNLNKQCFQELTGDYVFMQDTIRHIPIYKK
jgi:hypothetical protein